MRFDELLKMADTLQWFKYIVRNVAFRNGKTVTFMPKPLFGDNGSGVITSYSIHYTKLYEVMGSFTTPDSCRFTLATSAACCSTVRFL